MKDQVVERIGVLARGSLSEYLGIRVLRCGGWSRAGLENFFHSEVFYALVELGFIVLIRTVIDYFLGKEIDELRAEP